MEINPTLKPDIKEMLTEGKLRHVLEDLIVYTGIRDRFTKFIDVEGGEYQTRIYYKAEQPIIEQKGFKFYCLQVYAYDENKDKDDDHFKDEETTEVHLICRGNASFDGIRDIWFGENGHLSYPDMRLLRIVLKMLYKLEEKYCKEAYC